MSKILTQPCTIHISSVTQSVTQKRMSHFLNELTLTMSSSSATATSSSFLFSVHDNRHRPSPQHLSFSHLKRRRFIPLSHHEFTHHPSNDVVSSPYLPKPLSSTNGLTPSTDGPRLRVAYQGVSGAYSEAAAGTAYPNCEPVPCEQFDTAFEAVERWLVDRAVLPIENSLGGSIHRNYDLLLRHSLCIVGEVKLPIRHCLMANPGVKIEDLKRVLSHPQALAQCEHTLAKFGVTRLAMDDTAGAAQFVALNKLEDAGAVASAAAARIYGLNILAEDIQDDSDNVTRFLMLAREPIIPEITGNDRPFKTSIVFSLVEGPGSLFNALAAFATRKINLIKIESRPLRKGNNGSSKCFDCYFYLDFGASMADPNARRALANLKEFATLLRVLGSYPGDTKDI